MLKKEPCKICGDGQTELEYGAAGLEVYLCASCGHRRSFHASMAGRPDYYTHTPDSERFVSSLKETRNRQAKAIISRWKRNGGQRGPWLDFGCGRGWFLEAARAEGIGDLQGFDASEISRSWLANKNFSVANPMKSDPYWPDWGSLPSEPKVISFLDVVEHFEDPEALLSRVLKENPRLEWLVIKVPVSDGVLFRTACGLKKASPGIYRQMFQAGTMPPHYQYFSRASLTRLLQRFPLEFKELWGDRDVDNLFHRIPPLEKLPGGRVAARAIGLFPADSVIAMLRVKL